MPVPSVLLDPPWRRARSASARPAPSIGVPQEPPRVVWEEGERERFRGSGAKPLGEVAEERLLQRLLDQIERDRPPASTDLARLSRDALSEIAEEVGSVTIDVTAMRLLLAELGDDFAARAVAIVRAAPRERGLFEAMAPVRASELAKTAASLFAQRPPPEPDALARPFAPSPADAWLARFPDAAAAGLVGSAANEADPAFAHARAALAWIAARGGMEAMRPAVARAGDALAAWLTPFAALAPLDAPWVALLAARGLDAPALALIAARDGGAAGSAAEHAALWVARALSGTARAAAVAWLEQHRATVEPVLTRAHTDDARTALALLGGDVTAGDRSLEDVPAVIPALPAFFDPKALPAPRLLDGTPLPPDAVRALGEMLRFSPLHRPYVGLAQVRAACDPASLDELAHALLVKWCEAGEPPVEQWALEASGKIGGDASMREVGAKVRGWARGAQAPRHAWDDHERREVLVAEGDRGFAYARAGCAVLAANGSDMALTVLDDLARNGSASWLRKEARAVLEGASEGRRVRPAELADEIVPDLGLDPSGAEALDLGPRSFRLSFDEALVPFLIDESGERVRGFPRARKDDDPEKTAAAKRRYQALTKDTKVIARQQVTALETAMCHRRVWTLEGFRERFVQHPLLRHLGRRLVWALEDASVVFRIAEDLSFADEADAAFTPASDARVILVHPILLGAEARARWIARLGDHGIVQPFAQLGREVFTVKEEERGETQLASAQGATTRRGRLVALTRRGWTPLVEDGDIREYARELPCGARARVAIAPGLAIGATDDEAELTVTSASCSWALDRLPKIDYSELMRDVDSLRPSAD